VKFDWSVIENYDGATPFLLSGGIGPNDAESILSIKHPMFAGVDLNSRFESAPAMKDVLKLKEFITEIRDEQD
ncbi:MAG: phosphoribosylanthranilate isomerase, partial [Paludibacteraceae bacterium]|nr:phosphoribosylanthranilate isomerase [Paludibacteraceae bacterium]